MCLKTNFAIALLFSLFFAVFPCFGGPEGVGGGASSPSGSASIQLMAKVFQTYWDTLGLILFQKFLCLALILAALPERRTWSVRFIPAVLIGNQSDVSRRSYAGFFGRVLACLIDELVFTAPAWIIGFGIFFATALVIDPLKVAVIQITTNFFMILMPAVATAFFESSKMQATPGKLLLKMKVTDVNGNRCGFFRALARRLAFAFSELSFGIGFLMMLWTKRKQCSHDLFANCFVVKVQ